MQSLYNFKKIQETQNVWLISFGDLLTLILCFFISVISLSPLNPARNTEAVAGTRIAPIKSEVAGPRILRLKPEDFTGASGLQPDTQIELKKFVESEGYGAKLLKVEACGGVNGELAAREILWLLKSQVLDSLDSARRVVYGFNPEACEEGLAARLVLDS